ncbi:MAG: cobalt-precorrin-6A reductase [Cyanobacteria bacterium J06639_16]
MVDVDGVETLPRQLWLIGGTQESRQLAAALAAAQIPHVITVVTPEAAGLYAPSPWCQVQVGAIAPEVLTHFFTTYNIAAVLDASHPFAVEISQTAIAACTHHPLPYLRYERPQATPPPDVSGVNAALVQTIASYDEILTDAVLAGERVLLTLGSRYLYRFQPWHNRASLFARILPTFTALRAALAAGFDPTRLIALRPPISIELESALWQQWQITQVITKASGAPGGEAVKRSLAQQLGIRLWILARPDLAYPCQTEDLQTAIAFCHQQLGQNQPK